MVMAVLQQVLALPATIHLAVRHTAIKLVGELCEWIEKHNAQCTMQVTPNYLLQAYRCSSVLDRRLASEGATGLLIMLQAFISAPRAGLS